VTGACSCPQIADLSTLASSGVSVSDVEEMHVESTLGVIAATWAIAMALGPVLQIRKILEHRSSRGLSIGYFLILLVGFLLWLAYGIAASSLVLVIPNVVAATVTAATIAVALRYRPEDVTRT
jgi:MtN3 and saliva related transmembrane protein